MSASYNFGLPVKNNYTNFVFHQNFLNESEIQQVNALWNQDSVTPATVYDHTSQIQQEEVRRGNLVFLNVNSQIIWLFDKLGHAAVSSNNAHFQFELLGFHQGLQLANYRENDHFNWHLDIGNQGTSNRKLSLSLQLDDGNSYEGGDLQFMVDSQVYNAPREKGTLIIFPSYILHRVTPITAGSRMSVVGWVTGPPFR